MNTLNVMWNAWSVDEGMIWGVESFQQQLVASRGVYSIGTSGDFNTTRPARIYKAVVSSIVAFTATTTLASKVLTAIPDTSNLQVGQQVIGPGIPPNSMIVAVVLNTSATLNNAATATATQTGTIFATQGNRNNLNIVTADTYYEHSDQGALAYTPDEIYLDYLTSGTNGTMNLYLYPVPRNGLLALELDMAVAFVSWAVGTNYSIPPAVQDAIEWAVAFRLLATFGAAVQQQVAQIVVAEGQKSEARLRKTNAFNRQLQPQDVVAPGSQQQPQPGQQAA